LERKSSEIPDNTWRGPNKKKNNNKNNQNNKKNKEEIVPQNVFFGLERECELDFLGEDLDVGELVKTVGETHKVFVSNKEKYRRYKGKGRRSERVVLAGEDNVLTLLKEGVVNPPKDRNPEQVN
jgi:hypothetical protein